MTVVLRILLRSPRPTRFPYTPLFRSVISANRGNGITVVGADSSITRPAIAGNRIGTDEAGETGDRSGPSRFPAIARSEEHTTELQSHSYLVCHLLLQKIIE